MATEFRQISQRCPIVEFPSGKILVDGLPDQLVEILPRPASAANQTEEEWKPWYFARVYGDDGIRFTEGLIARNLTKPLEQAVDEEGFAKGVADSAALFGVNPAHLLAAAKYLSDIKNVQRNGSAAAGPFLFTEASWATVIAGAPQLELTPSDRFDPDRQPGAAAAVAANILQRFRTAALPDPGSAEQVFAHLFGQLSVDVLVTRAQQPAAGPDPSIDIVIGNYCTSELRDAVTKQAVIDEIAAAHPDLLGSRNAFRTASQVLQHLRTALEPLVASASGVLARLIPPPPPPPPPPSPPPSPPNGGNLQLGANSVFQNEILEAATACGMDPAGLAALIDAEAAKLRDGTWNKNSANPTSTAVGLTQFLKGSWIDMAKRSQSTLHQAAQAQGFIDANNRILNEAALLALRTDPRLSIMSAAEYAATNLRFVMSRNPPPNYRGFYDPGTSDGKMRLAYLCHHEGPGGALTYLRGGKPATYVDFLDGYIDRKIVPSRFRSSVTVVGPGPDLSLNRDLNGPSTTTRPGNGVIPDNVVPIPAARPVDFAVLQAPQEQWHWPVITGDTQAMKVSYRTGPTTFAGRPSRAFLASRQEGRRFHVGMDIFCQQGDVVVAIASGTIVRFYAFYQGTNALLIAHGGVVVNYGEVAPSSDNEFEWKEGSQVREGQRIARVGRLNMIHFETYRPGQRNNERWMQDGSPAPTNLLNPTKLLLGLAARGKRILS
jgi:hypothetical protein